MASAHKSTYGWRILIADRNAHFRQTIRKVLEAYPRCEVIEEATSLREAREKIDRLNPDLVLLDLALVANPALAPLRRLAEEHPSLRIVVLLTEYSQDYRRAVQALGQYICVAKDQLEEHLAWALGSVAPTVQ